MSGETDHQKDAELYDLKDRLIKAEWVLERLNYRHCDIPACNCNGYHRMTEPDELDRLRQDNERLKGELAEGVKLMQEFVAHAKADDATIQRNKSCLEVARGALEQSRIMMMHVYEFRYKDSTGSFSDKLHEQIRRVDATLHQINEVLGDSTKTT